MKPFGRWPVIAGTFLAFLLPDLLAVLLAAAALFLVFAWKTWKDSDEEEPKIDDAARRRAFITSFTLILVAKLGDKTQLALVVLAAESGEP